MATPTHNADTQGIFTVKIIKFPVKWSGKINVTYEGIKWSFIAVHEMNGDPYFGDYIEHLQVKCPEKKINMIIYHKEHRGSL